MACALALGLHEQNWILTHSQVAHWYLPSHISTLSDEVRFLMALQNEPVFYFYLYSIFLFFFSIAKKKKIKSNNNSKSYVLYRCKKLTDRNHVALGLTGLLILQSTRQLYICCRVLRVLWSLIFFFPLSAMLHSRKHMKFSFAFLPSLVKFLRSHLFEKGVHFYCVN